MECFGYKCGCVIVVGMHVLRCLKEELAWVTDGFALLVTKIVIYTTEKMKNKPLL